MKKDDINKVKEIIEKNITEIYITSYYKRKYIDEDGIKKILEELEKFNDN